MVANKALGQHWLTDRDMLASIADEAELEKTDTVLEIGPGLGTLTSELLRRAGQVVAVEFDEALARKLPASFPGTHLEVIHEDILQFDLSSLPAGYKVVANVPYYITSKIVQYLLTSTNRPARIVLLVQKEVAERLAAQPGDLSILGVSAQLYAKVTLGKRVPAEYFSPPPKVDSQVVIMDVYADPGLGTLAEADFFRVVRAGFSAKRKKLRSSLAGGLHISKQAAELLLEQAQIDPNTRAETVTIDQWKEVARIYGS